MTEPIVIESGAIVESLDAVSRILRLDPLVQRNEVEFHQLLENLPTGAYTCDPDGLITYFNPHAERIWGRKPQLRHRDDRFCGSFKLLTAEGKTVPHDQCWMALALQMNREFNGQEIVIEREDGRRMTVLAHANPIHAEDGTLLGAVNVVVDISERKRAEKALADADRAKNEFLATLAHELRNPLAPIRNAVQILHLKGSPIPEHKWALDVIDRQMNQMTRLIDDLLDIARITGNKLQIRKEHVTLSDVLDTAIETSRPLIEACGQQFVISVPSFPVTLECDATRLAQVISNLLNNAAKYTERGGTIWFTVERQESDAVISVRDNGVGIAADMLPSVFEMFTQVQGEVERAQGGLGIGLTLVKRLVEMHGGSIAAKSDGPGTGSEFIVRLPVVLEPQPAKGKSDSSLADAQTSSLRILVVDDNRDSAASLGMLLRITGNDIRLAHDGREAVTLAESFRPNVVLLDLGLPVLNGYEAAKAIRAEPWGTNMVVIATTGWNQDTDRDRTKDAGFDYHLVKPIDHQMLKQLLSSLTQAKS